MACGPIHPRCGRWSFARAQGSVHVVPAVHCDCVRAALLNCGGTQTRAGGEPDLPDSGVLWNFQRVCAGAL